MPRLANASVVSVKKMAKQEMELATKDNMLQLVHNQAIKHKLWKKLKMLAASSAISKLIEEASLEIIIIII